MTGRMRVFMSMKVAKPPHNAATGLLGALRGKPRKMLLADWIDANQLGRRNLTPDQMSLLRGRRYNRAKGKQGGDHRSKYQNDTLIDTAARLAKEHGVSAPTIKRDGQFARKEKRNWLGRLE